MSVKAVSGSAEAMTIETVYNHVDYVHYSSRPSPTVHSVRS